MGCPQGKYFGELFPLENKAFQTENTVKLFI
jgi:hypothetical protein